MELCPFHFKRMGFFFHAIPHPELLLTNQTHPCLAFFSSFSLGYEGAKIRLAFSLEWSSQEEAPRENSTRRSANLSAHEERFRKIKKVGSRPSLQPTYFI